MAYSLWLIAILFALPAYAAPPPTTALKNPIGTQPNCANGASAPGAICDLPSLAGSVIKAGLGIAGAIALAMFVWGGFLWLTAAGNPTKIKEGKDTLIWAVIGLVFIFSSYIIANFVIAGLTGG